jgi:hypothetical protein
MRCALGGGVRATRRFTSAAASEGEGSAPLRRVLVPPVVEATQPAVRNGPGGATPAESLEALFVIAVHGGTGVEGEAHTGGDEAAGRDGHLQRCDSRGHLQVDPQHARDATAMVGVRDEEGAPIEHDALHRA